MTTLNFDEHNDFDVQLATRYFLSENKFSYKNRIYLRWYMFVDEWQNSDFFQKSVMIIRRILIQWKANQWCIY